MKHLNPKLKNRLKNTALFVLTLLLVVLTALSWLGDLNLGDLPADSWLGRLYISLSYGEAGGFTLRSGEFPAARPVEIAVQTETGMKGAQYNENAVSGFLSVLEQPIGAALSAATDFELAEESELSAGQAGRVCAVSLRAAALAHRELDGRKLSCFQRPKCTVSVFWRGRRSVGAHRSG